MNSVVMSWVLAMSGSPWTYLALAFIIAIGGILTFLPSQSLLVAITTLEFAQTGFSLNVLWIFLGACIGMLLGDLMTFRVAKLFGVGKHRFLNGARVSSLRQRTRTQLADRPYVVFITGRLIPMGRLATTLASADAGLPIRRFTRLAGSASVVWVAYSMILASIVGAWVKLHPALLTVLAVVISIVVGLAFQQIQTIWLARREAKAMQRLG